MPIIRPISDLRNNFSEISKVAHHEDEPIFFTKNGIGDLVVMSIEHYEKQLSKLELYSELEKSEIEISLGAKGIPAIEFLNNLK